MNATKLSVVIPARDEADSLAPLLQRLHESLGKLPGEPASEIIVVDDASTDDTAAVAEAAGAQVLRHPYGKGNGAAIKSGVRAAQGEVILCLDADGQHPPEIIPSLLERVEQGYDMAVGARSGLAEHAGWWRALANRIYNRFASWMVGHPIADLTSGLRAVKAPLFRRFLYLLPNGFSYPTTLTMCFFRCGLSVAYVPSNMSPRGVSQSKSHIRPLSDGLRFLLIIFKVGAYFSPLRVFFPISFTLLACGFCYYAYTYLTMHRLTNMSVILFINAIIVFLIGIVAEQITALLYKDSE